MKQERFERLKELLNHYGGKITLGLEEGSLVGLIPHETRDMEGSQIKCR